MKHLLAKKILILGMMILISGTTFTFAINGTGTNTVEPTLSEQLLQKKKNLNISFTTITQKLNSEYARLILPLKQSADYQSLLCLGIIAPDSIISNIETELGLTQTNMLQEFVNINAKVFALYNRYSVGLIDYTIFTTEYAILQIEVTDFYEKYNTLSQQIDLEYLQKIFNLSQDVQQYSTQNNELLLDVHEKIVLIQNTVDIFSTVEQGILEMNNGLGINQNIFFSTLETMRNNAVNELISDLENNIQTIQKTYPQSKTDLYEILYKEKNNLLTLYKADLDYKMTNIFGDRYDRDEYLYVKEQANLLKSNFYEGDKISCTKVLGTELDLDTYGEGLNQQVKEFMNNLEKGLVFIQNETTEGTALKDEIMLTFQSFYTTRYQEDMNSFRNFSNEQAKISPYGVITQTETQNIESTKYPEGFIFNRSFIKGEKSDDVKVLQTLLTDLGIYTDSIDGIYGPLTSTAVYEFQKKNLDSSLLINSLSHGYVGPSTQKALNDSLEIIKNTTTEQTTVTEEVIIFTPKTQEDLILTYLYKIGKKFSSQDSFKIMLNNGISVIDEKLQNTSLTVKQRLFILDLKGAVYRYLETN